MAENMFGGKNARSLYIPMSETEQEVIARLVETQDLRVIVHGWTVIDSPKVTYGDKNLQVPINIVFEHPSSPVDVYYFDLELVSISTGASLFRKKMDTCYGGAPLKVMEGLELGMIWDIAVKYIDPKLVKLVKPNATGLTSRLQDTLTGEMTVFGNMNLDRDQKQAAMKLKKSEEWLAKISDK